MNIPVPKPPIGTMVHYASELGADCRAAMIVGYNDYGSADLLIFKPDGIDVKPAHYGEISDGQGWHIIH